jgi:hypothetical protein
LCAVAILLIAAPALAVTFTGTSSGTWSNPVSAQASPTYSGVGTNYFTWGVPFTEVSSVLYAGAPFSADAHTTFAVGGLTYHNGTIYSGTGVDGVDLNLDLTLTSPFADTETFSFTFTIFDTTNTGDPGESADYLYLPSSYPSTFFNYDGCDYTLKLLGFSQDGGATITDTFHVLEGASTDALLYAQITNPAPAVPEPCTMLLVGAGLAGLASLRRRRG